ncbi:MAG: hypothetical protein QOE70_6474 [Chthoniobacter sp.]|jgi:GT2 family glycosyltransferase|nr:hypothetical protein [Chthoniobacter sp.]
MELVRISIIIPVFNKISLTAQCLNTLLARRNGFEDFEIIVIDDHSTDNTPDLLRSYGDQIRVVTHPSNCGFAISSNDGANLALGEYLLFLNNDTIPQPGWLGALVRYADARPKAAAVGAKMLFPNHTVQHAGVVICHDKFPRHIYATFPSDHPAVNKSRQFQIITAGCALMRKEAFQRARGFDPAYRNGLEDVDLCLRLGEMGYELHYQHESVLIHLESVSRDVWTDSGLSSSEEHNKQLYWSRWAHRIHPDDFKYYLEDGLMKVQYDWAFPFHLAVAPELGVIEDTDHRWQADKLLNVRSRQVYDLMKDTVRLSVQLKEAEWKATESPRPPGVNGSAPHQTPVAEPRLLHEGVVHWMSQESSGRLISILLPVKNGADKLRALLPRILSQQTRDTIEFVAIDSGSTDASVDVLREFGATVWSIDPRSFNHGLTRAFAASKARGSVFVFVNQSATPADEHWLANLVAALDGDPLIAGVCSRTQVRPEADLLTAKDVPRDYNSSLERQIRSITDFAAYRALSHQALRALVNFHSMSAAIRPEVFAKIPFRKVTIGEDILWAKEVLEAGYKIQHEPSSVILHSHNYSHFELLQRCFDDGIANHEIVGRDFADHELIGRIFWHAKDDWRYLDELGCFQGDELEWWRMTSLLRRTAQHVGDWLGVNHERWKGDLRASLSLTERIKAGAVIEAAGIAAS